MAFNSRLITLREKGDSDRVTFKVRPELSISSSANYVDVSEIRQAASIMIYMGSPSRSLSVNAKLVSRTVREADMNFEILHKLRSWRMPRKDSTGGDTTPDSPPGLQLCGYGLEDVGNFRAIDCVMVGLNEDFPVDVDYITCSNKAEMPIIMTVSISLKEIHDPASLDKVFNFAQYKSGMLKNW